MTACPRCSGDGMYAVSRLTTQLGSDPSPATRVRYHAYCACPAGERRMKKELSRGDD